MHNSSDTYIMSEAFTAYVAGFFDGEGSISIKNTGKNTSYRLSISIGQRRPEPLFMIQSRWGGSIGKREIGKREANNFSTLLMFSKQAVSFIKDIYPYLVVKRKQAEIAIKFQEGKENTGRRGMSIGRKEEEATMKREIEFINGYGDVRQQNVMLSNIGSRAAVTKPMFAHQCVPGAVESLAL